MRRKRSPFYRVPADIEEELERLRALAAELGAEAGLHDLSNGDSEFEAAMRARLVVLTHDVWGVPSAAESVEPQAARVHERDLLLATLTMPELRHEGTEPHLWERRDRRPWRTGLAVAICVVAAGLMVEAGGRSLGPVGWALDGVCAIGLAVTLPVLVRLCRNVHAFANYALARHRTCARIRQLDREINAVNDRRRAGAERQDTAARWVHDQCGALVSLYRLHRSRGYVARGRRLAIAA